MERGLIEGSGLHWEESADRDSLAQKLSDAIVDRLHRAVETSHAASLVVSGGSTPAPLFACLSSADIDWSRVQVTLADERWVAPGHPDSNESLVRRTLLVNKAASAEFVPLYRENLTPEAAVQSVGNDVQSMQHPFTVVILGMGNDGHTASLFPDAPADELSRAMAMDSRDILVVMHPPSQPLTRLSLTRAALLDAEHRYLHITGEDKLAVLNEALRAAPEGRYVAGAAPITGLLDQQLDAASVYWAP